MKFWLGYNLKIVFVGGESLLGEFVQVRGGGGGGEQIFSWWVDSPIPH